MTPYQAINAAYICWQPVTISSADLCTGDIPSGSIVYSVIETHYNMGGLHLVEKEFLPPEFPDKKSFSALDSAILSIECPEQPDRPQLSQTYIPKEQ